MPQEELDYVLTSISGTKNSRLRIALYLENHSDKESTAYIRQEYGTSGQNHTFLNGERGWIWSDSEGITVTRGYVAKFLLNWSKAQKRIRELLAAGRYLNEEEEKALPVFRANLEEQRQQAAEEARGERPENAVYEYFEGTIVYVGTQKYTIDTLSADSVVLRDQEFPLFTKTYSRENFEAIMRENPLNDPLIAAEPTIRDETTSTPEEPAGQIETVLAADAAEMPEQDQPVRTIGDIYNEYEPVIISRVINDEAYLKAREGFQNEAAARKECTEAIKRAVKDLGGKNPELARVYREMPEFVRRLRDRVFKATYTDFVKMARRIERMGKPQKTTAQRNYDTLMALAPEVLTGEARVLRFSAGEAFMPLTVERIGENRLAISHTYQQNGDQMADPDMEFVFDIETGSLSARTYQQDGLNLFQSVEAGDGRINTRLEKELNTFTRQWFSNLKGQHYSRTSMIVLSQNIELEARYEPDGHIIAFRGWDREGGQPLAEWMAAVRTYAQAHDVLFDIGYGYLGNGLTVYNRLEEENHDFKTIAHISPDGKLNAYAELPAYVMAELELAAKDEHEAWLEHQAEQQAQAAGSPAALPAEKEKRTPAGLYREYLSIVLKEIRGGSLYSFLRDRDVDVLDAEQELGHEIDGYVESLKDAHPEFYAAYKELPEFKAWLVEDVLAQTYQDYTGPDDQITLHADDPNAPEWVHATGPVTITRQGDTFTLDRAGSTGGPYVEFDMELPDEAQEPAPKAPPVSIEQKLEEVLETVSDCKGYAAFSADVKKLLLNKNGDSIVGITADHWLQTIVDAPETELRQYVEQYEQGTLDAYSAIREPTPATASDVTIGQEIELDGRRFSVDTINDEEVSLRDLTFQGSAGFPIFRSERLDFVRRSLEQQAEKERPLAHNQHVEEIDGQEFLFTTVTPKEPEQLRMEEIAAGNTESQNRQRRHVNHSGVFFPGEIILQELKTGPEKHNYRIPAEQPEVTGAKSRYHCNIEAIRLLKQIEAENRLATPQEQETLSLYVGWGGIPQAFDEGNTDWTKEYAELKELLTEEEYASARGSTLNAHYTAPVVIQAMYDTVARMGFQTGNILEPSCGTGRFFGLLPKTMQKSRLYGVELDSLTGRISHQLYQDAQIAVQGYEQTDLPDSFFDIAIGNVPFGGYGVTDKRYEKQHWLIHDYFFGKTLDKVRPGGIIAFVTSKGTMDKRDDSVRRYIAQRAELLGAVRLPNSAFQKSAGTEVTTDILFLQKRDGPEDVAPEWIHLSETEDGIPVNAYYAEHPEMVLGTMEYDKSMYGDSTDTTCRPIEGADLAAQLAAATAHIQAEITEYDLDDLTEQEDASIPADPDVRNFSFTLVKGEIYYRENSRMNKAEVPKTTESRIRGMIALRDCVRSLIDLQTEDSSDEAITHEQARLNRLYDDYTRKYGLLNSRGNRLAFEDDSSYCLLCSLEVLDENGGLKRKADMFTKRTIRRPVAVTHVDTPSEALTLSMAEKARVDLPYMSEVTGQSEQQLAEALAGVIFHDFGDLEPENVPWAFFDSDKFPYVTADEYLSGDVRRKLKQARGLYAMLKEHGRGDLAEKEIRPQVEVLERVQPEDLTAGEISVRLGAVWLPEDVVQDFTFHLLETPEYARDYIKVHFTQFTGDWTIEGKARDKDNVRANATYGTPRAPAYKIIEDCLNLRDTRVYDPKEDEEGRRTYVLNKDETRLAQNRQKMIKAAFADWIWQDQTRRDRLVQIYNERFNSFRPRTYDGSHLKFPGMNPEIQLLPHQVNAVAHILYGGNTLLAHVVGAGKTWEITAAIMESKRLGLAEKPIIVVPKHLTEQWAAEFLQLYPAANLLVAREKDFETKNRKRFCGRIATGDYDAVIVGHSQFEKIPMSLERQQRLLKEQIDELTEGLEEIKKNKGERTTVKQLEASRKKLQVRLEKLTDRSRKDDLITFEQTGIDRLYVDEAHYYKNLFLVTKMRNVAGLSTAEAQKSSDLFLKCRYLDEKTDSHGTVFATGTPISNSMTELYTMQRYLQYENLRRSGLTHFDAWASSFGETITSMELAPEGKGYRLKTRFARFFNLPELMSMFRMVADIQTADMLKLPVPTAHCHNIAVEPSKFQEDMVAELGNRADKVRNGDVDPREDNMLAITNDGRKLALDQRLMNDLLPDDPGSKVNACVDNVFQIWKDTEADRLTQLIFCDLSTPHGDGSFNVYDDVKTKLLARGVPAEEVAFIHDAHTDLQRAELFAKVRSGQVRVLLGSTQKMGAGTNVQDKLIAIHDLDCPWRPADLEQRSGRIIRRGNDNDDVHVYRYVTQGTFDAYLYQLVEAKQRFISQIMTSKTPVRVAEDIDEVALSYAEIKALAAGDPKIKEKMDLEVEVSQLKALKASHLNLRYSLEDRLAKHYPLEIKRLEEQITGLEADIARLITPQGKDKDGKKLFSAMTLNGQTYAEKEDAGKALLAVLKEYPKLDEPVEIGSYRGFTLELSFNAFSKEYGLSAKGALHHFCTLGTDVFGNLTRLDNALEAMPQRLTESREKLENTRQQVEQAKAEAAKPFPQEAELQEKSLHLIELEGELKLDDHDPVVMEEPGDAPDYEAPQKMAVGYDR